LNLVNLLRWFRPRRVIAFVTTPVGDLQSVQPATDINGVADYYQVTL
jgi:hypothetical protein